MNYKPVILGPAPRLLLSIHQNIAPRSKQRDHAEQHNQCGLLDQAIAGTKSAMTKPNIQTSNAGMWIPATNVPTRQQKKNSEAGGIRIQHSLHAGQQQQIYGGKEGQPMYGLGPDQAELCFFIVRVAPAAPSTVPPP